MLAFFIRLFSLLPLRILYAISTCACFIIYRVVGYRKQLVWDNLKHAYPEKSDDEIKLIMGRFYQSFCDHWIETMKLLTMPLAELNSRITANWEVFDQLNEANKDCYALVGHTFNWEWLNVAWPTNMQQQYACFYTPITNKGFDKLMYKIRTRTGGWQIPMSAKKGLARLQGTRFVLGLAADQNPVDIKHAKWLPFMHREAPFFQGPEKLARRSGGAVVFASIKKQQRGYYKVHFELICADASATEQGEITTQYVQFVEQQLRDQPENWLWSHRRWKHKRLLGE
jgi:KDO2-lipid IV(A) lauroyltransferase